MILIISLINEAKIGAFLWGEEEIKENQEVWLISYFQL